MASGSYSEHFGGGFWSGYGHYLRHKTEKMKAQLADQTRKESDTLSGCVCWIDGRTELIDWELRKLIVAHGGIFEPYDLRRVTHIIADNVAMGNQKWRALRDRGGLSKKFKVIKSQWILDCVDKGKRLPEFDYLPEAIAIDSRRGRNDSILSVLTKNNRTCSEDPAMCPSMSDEVDNGDASTAQNGGLETACGKGEDVDSHGCNRFDRKGAETKKDSNLSSLLDSPPRKSFTRKETQNSIISLASDCQDDSDWQTAIEQDYLSCDRSLGGSVNRGDLTSTTCHEEKAEKALTVVRDDDFLAPRGGATQICYSHTIVGDSGSCTAASKTGSSDSGQSDADAVASKDSRRILTTADPNFVDNFFRSSRLHFIGTWRDRLVERFHFEPFLTPTNILTPAATGEQGTGNLLSFGFKTPSPSRNRNSSEGNVQNFQPYRILHVDFDAFFVSVALKSHPHLEGKPVGVAHATGRDGQNSHSEMASCNYIARSFGVRKGMFVSSAKKLCPDIIIVGYDFAAIEQASLQMFETLTEFTPRILPVSCDEAYLQILFSDSESSIRLEKEAPVDPSGRPAFSCSSRSDFVCAGAESVLSIARSIRERVFERTKCYVSIGIGANLFLAKLASGVAKPDGKASKRGHEAGIFEISATPSKAKEFLKNVKLKEIPGVGVKTVDRLNGILAKGLSVVTCNDVLKNFSRNQLKILLGEKNGSTIWFFCNGIDSRPFPCLPTSRPHQYMDRSDIHQENANQQRHSVFKGDNETGYAVVEQPPLKKTLTVAVNWGVRLYSKSGLLSFLRQLAAECERRLLSSRTECQRIGMKVLRRRKDQPVETLKFGGHGICDELFARINLPSFAGRSSEIEKGAIFLWDKTFSAQCPIPDLRGITIVLSKFRWSKVATSYRGPFQQDQNIKNVSLPIVVNNFEMQEDPANEKDGRQNPISHDSTVNSLERGCLKHKSDAVSASQMPVTKRMKCAAASAQMSISSFLQKDGATLKVNWIAAEGVTKSSIVVETGSDSCTSVTPPLAFEISDSESEAENSPGDSREAQESAIVETECSGCHNLERIKNSCESSSSFSDTLKDLECILGCEDLVENGTLRLLIFLCHCHEDLCENGQRGECSRGLSKEQSECREIRDTIEQELFLDQFWRDFRSRLISGSIIGVDYSHSCCPYYLTPTLQRRKFAIKSCIYSLSIPKSASDPSSSSLDERKRYGAGKDFQVISRERDLDRSNVEFCGPWICGICVAQKVSKIVNDESRPDPIVKNDRFLSAVVEFSVSHAVRQAWEQALASCIKALQKQKTGSGQTDIGRPGGRSITDVFDNLYTTKASLEQGEMESTKNLSSKQMKMKRRFISSVRRWSIMSEFNHSFERIFLCVFVQCLRSIALCFSNCRDLDVLRLFLRHTRRRLEKIDYLIHDAGQKLDEQDFCAWRSMWLIFETNRQRLNRYFDVTGALGMETDKVRSAWQTMRKQALSHIIELQKEFGAD